MKSFVGLITVLLFSSLSYTQVNYPIPQDGTSEWRIWRSTWDPLTSIVQSSDFRVFVSGDTTINGKVYSVLLNSGLKTYEYQGITNTWSFENEFYAFIRTDSARTFVSFFGEQEQLLYDFTLHPGDTLPETIINHGTVVISSIDSVLAGDKYLKRFNIYDSIYEDLISHWYIEGIGHENGLIEPMYMMLDNGWLFECYAENGIPVLPEGSDCDLTVAINEEAVNDQEVSVYPNPSTGIINVAYNNNFEKDVQLKVVGILGNVLINNTWQLSNGLNIKAFDLTKASKGLYFVIIQDGGSTVKKKVTIAN
jgi:hypothetical protein